MIVVAFEILLVTTICLLLIPRSIVMLAAVMFQDERAELPMARLLRKRKTGRRFQRPAFQQLS